MDGASITQLLIAILGPAGLATLLTALYTKKKIYAEAEKQDIDAADVITKASLALIEPLNRQIGDLTEKLQKAETRTAELTDQLYYAKMEISSLRLEISSLNRKFTDGN